MKTDEQLAHDYSHSQDPCTNKFNFTVMEMEAVRKAFLAGRASRDPEVKSLRELLTEAQNIITQLDRDVDFWTSSEFREKCDRTLEPFKEKV